MVLTLPEILDDYYDEIEQSIFKMSNRAILADCEYIIGELAIGEWYSYNKNDVIELKRFTTLLRRHITTATVINKH